MGQELEDFLDAGRNRLGDHLEISELHFAQGDNSSGRFYSVAVANNMQQADLGTKMVHIGSNTSSTIVSKGISTGPWPEQLSRAGGNPQERNQRATSPNATRC